MKNCRRSLAQRNFNNSRTISNADDTYNGHSLLNVSLSDDSEDSLSDKAITQEETIVAELKLEE